ncbi:MAG: S-adenosylmethionine:tRNA ribosyltransferase-isomerase, partial [Phormidesmis sp. CAN_BIN36]|nr:S-adenosylmethionine:tRNA ribosyltransferase-isomerase [Phormidesmis sp. CAN_BIN36]
MDADFLLSAYDYELPKEQIAQTAVIPRDSAQLLVIKDQSQHSHHIFRELPDLLKSGDLLILNNTRVLPARLYGQKPGGTKVEVLLLEEQQTNQWLALVKPGRRLKPDSKIIFTPLHSDCSISLSAIVVASDEATRGRVIEFEIS